MWKFVLFLSAILYGANAELQLERITDGSAAAYSQFPYVVSIQQVTNVQNHAHKCGGALISYQYVLTTASCTSEVINGVVTGTDATQFRVYAGSTLLSSATTVDSMRTVSGILRHPEYIGAPAFLNDIAILTLTTPFPNATVTPIRIGTNDSLPLDLTVCTTAGWGAVNKVDYVNNELRYATKYIYNQAQCSNVYSLIQGTANVFPSMICAASKNIVSVGCTGDLGNPLVCNNELTGLLFLSNNCSATSYPELYTRVSHYRSWITSVTGSASTFNPPIGLLALFAVICGSLLK